MTRRMELRWGAATHLGRIRQGNEDAFVACPNLFVVADGMGGHNAGEVASAMAVATLSSAASNGVRSPDELEMLIRGANAAIFTASSTYADQRGMGTTITTIARMNSDDSENGTKFELVIANVGDSRTYLKRNNELSRITLDHSYVQALVNEGFISAAEARIHPRRNIVTRALGIEADVEVDTSVIEVQHGDRFVLCSDGLVDEADDEEIDTVLYSHETPQMAAEDLISLANDHGGRDNTTVIVVDVIIYDATPAGGMPVTEPMSNVEEVLRSTDELESVAVGETQKVRRFGFARIAAVVGIASVITVLAVLIFG
jgi:PPM family protein phosphatase